MYMTFREAADLYFGAEEAEARRRAILAKIHNLARLEAERAPAEERARRQSEQMAIDALEAAHDSGKELWQKLNAVFRAAVARLEATSKEGTRLSMASYFRLYTVPGAEDLLAGKQRVEMPFGTRGWSLCIDRKKEVGAYALSVISERCKSIGVCYAQTLTD